MKNVQNRKIVLVSGNFNIVHPGHLRLLYFAKGCGDKLIVALFHNNANTFVDFEDRKAALLALDTVDSVLEVNEDDLGKVLLEIKPSIVVKGKEHEVSNNLEKKILETYGGKLIFASGEIQFSSKDLLRKEIFDDNYFKIYGSEDFQKKHKIDIPDLVEQIKKFNSAKVLVIGDIILDEYVYCDPLGMSQEDPTIVVTPVDTKYFLGGAGIVAAHLVGLGAKASIMSVVGSDEISSQVKKSLTNYLVDWHLVIDESRPTIRKQRFRAENKTLLRVSHLRSHDISSELISEMLHNFVRIVDSIDIVIFSDFNYGCLPQSFVDDVIQICQRRKIHFFADSQASSQVGDISRFKGATFLAATEREARLAMNDFKSGLQTIANGLLEKSQTENLIIKLGAEGLIALKKCPRLATDSLAAFNTNPKDVAGAGDALLSTSALAFYLGNDIWKSSFLGSIAAAIQVSRIGNVPMQQNDLINTLASLQIKST
tara:strand:- start:104 stop:1555 length:1452 start_codon:yes stop_codon:yes gene_type:complete